MRAFGGCLAVFALSACATTARMHTPAELNAAGAECGLALGELIQDEEAKKMLILLREKPTAAEQACVQRFARSRGLKPVFIDAITDAQN